MARIRTIKPEFLESESIGKLSRDARLLFVQLWLFVDDSGRARASSRLLASRLYPYDEDAPELIDGWLQELVDRGHVRLYEVEDQRYLDIPKWLEHQKIDHPAKSRIPEFREVLGEPREDVRESRASYLGPRTKDLGPRTEEEGGAVAPAIPLEEAIEAYNVVADQSGWAKAQRLTPSRKTALTKRLAECGGLEGWQCAMAKAGASKFLTGKLPRGPTHKNWRPDFDWFVTASNFTKLMEGSYDDSPGSDTAPAGVASDFARAADLLRDKQYHGI